MATRKVSDAISMGPSEAPTEAEARKRIKHGGACQAAQGIFTEYCHNSTVHGMKYLGERRRTPIERVFWIITFALSLYFCGRLIWNIYVKWDTSPVIVSFAEKSTPVWQVRQKINTISGKNIFIHMCLYLFIFLLVDSISSGDNLPRD